MQKSYGTIKKGDQVLLDNIPIRFEVNHDQRSGLKEWYGSFELSSGSPIELGSSYSLILSDGRSGDILISNIQTGSSRNSAQFRGSGSFQ